MQSELTVEAGFEIHGGAMMMVETFVAAFDDGASDTATCSSVVRRIPATQAAEDLDRFSASVSPLSTWVFPAKRFRCHLTFSLMPTSYIHNGKGPIQIFNGLSIHGFRASPSRGSIHEQLSPQSNPILSIFCGSNFVIYKAMRLNFRFYVFEGKKYREEN